MNSMNARALQVLRTLRSHHHEAYFVGGCVRDLLLGREPDDYDITTNAHPDVVMKLFPRTEAVGAHFGVVLVLEDDAKGDVSEQSDAVTRAANAVEVATYRSDGNYSDGRRPDTVTYAKTAEEDVTRRDFSINGLLLDPLAAPDEHTAGLPGKVLDFVGGRDDLKAGVIRAIGNPTQRFTEDKLRMLRAVRFAARFGFTIEPQTMAAITKLAPQIHQVSAERQRDELTRMLTEGHARRAFELLEETGLLAELLPEVTAMRGVEQPPQYHPEGDVWIHTRMLLENLPAGCEPTLAWGALLHDVGKPPTFERAPDRIRFSEHDSVGARMAQHICGRLRISNDDTAQIVALVGQHMKFIALPKMRASTLKRFLRQQRFEEHMALHRLDCLASHRKLDLYELAKEKIATMPPEEIRPVLLVNGGDLIAAGYAPGPRFKQMLHDTEDAQLEGAVKTKEEAMEFIRQRFGGPGCG
jgi:poly(A) polymerase